MNYNYFLSKSLQGFVAIQTDNDKIIRSNQIPYLITGKLKKC
jgi:hypothetical protein